MPAEIVPGLARLSLPLPNDSLGSINVYTVMSTDGLRLIDCGWNAPETYAAQVDELQQLGKQVSGIREILVTVLALNRYYGWYAQGGQLEVAKAYLPAELTDWHRVRPDKPMMFTEYGADTIAGFHDTTSVMFSEEYEVACLQANHEVVDEFPTFIGEQVWNFADFQTSQGICACRATKRACSPENASRKWRRTISEHAGWPFQTLGTNHLCKSVTNIERRRYV